MPRKKPTKEVQSVQVLDVDPPNPVRHSSDEPPVLVPEREVSKTLALKVSAVDLGAKKLATVGRSELEEMKGRPAHQVHAAYWGHAAVRVDPEGLEDEDIDAFAKALRGVEIPVRVLPRRKGSVLPDSVVERAARRSVREVVAELVAGAAVPEVDRPKLASLVEAKMSEVGL